MIEYFVGLVCGGLCGAVMAIVLTIPPVAERPAIIRAQAVEAGVARYVVNEKTGEVKFVWITPTPTTNPDEPLPAPPKVTP